MLGAPAGLGYGNGAPTGGYYGNPGASQGLGGVGAGAAPVGLSGQPQMMGQPGSSGMLPGGGGAGVAGGVGQAPPNPALVPPGAPQAAPGQQGPGCAPGAGGPPAQQQQPGQMQQAHAIHYVTKIRNRFSTEPDTYRLQTVSSSLLCLLGNRLTEPVSLLLFRCAQVVPKDPAHVPERAEGDQRGAGAGVAALRRPPRPPHGVHLLPPRRRAGAGNACFALP